MVVIILGFYFLANTPLFKLVPLPHNHVVIVVDLLLCTLSPSNMHDRKIRVCMQKSKIKTNSMTNTRQKCMKIDNTMHTITPRVSSTCCL